MVLITFQGDQSAGIQVKDDRALSPCYKVEAVPKTRILRIEIFDPELEENVSHPTPLKMLYKASFRNKYDRVRQRSMVELYLNMPNKRRANGIIDIEFVQNSLKTVFITAF